MRFDSEFLKTLEYLHIVSTRAFAGSGRGERQGRNRGRGLEFADYRQYVQGDDFRHIDWKAYKRLNRLLLRLFDEEQDLSIYLLLDTSRSMAAHGKFDHARRIAAALCYIGLAHLDRVSLLPFSDHLGTDTSTGRAKHTIARVFESLEELEADGATDLWSTTSEFARQKRRQGLVVLISDFLDASGYERPLKFLASMGHDVFAIHVSSRQDVADGSMSGDVCLVDAETGERRTIEITPGLAKAYARAWQEQAERLESCCLATQAGYIRADADEPFEHVILHTFRTGRFLE